MSWRNHRTHAEETAAVKAALRKAAIRFRKVGHGSGTAWGWLEIYLGPNPPTGEVQRALAVARATTNRSGDYDGNINIYTQ